MLVNDNPSDWFMPPEEDKKQNSRDFSPAHQRFDEICKVTESLVRRQNLDKLFVAG